MTFPQLRRTRLVLIAPLTLALAAPLLLRAVPVHAEKPNEASQFGPVDAGSAPIQLDLDDRRYLAYIDLDRAIGQSVDFRAMTNTLTSRGRTEVNRLAARLKTADSKDERYLILVSSDDATPGGRSGKTGFERARSIRGAIVEAKVAEDKIVVAGWRPSPDDRGVLPILAYAGRVVIVPVRFAPMSSDSKVDVGRTLAFDTAISRLTTAHWIPRVADIALPTPAPAPPSDVRVVLPSPWQTAAKPSPAAQQNSPVRQEDRSASSPSPALPPMPTGTAQQPGPTETSRIEPSAHAATVPVPARGPAPQSYPALSQNQTAIASVDPVIRPQPQSFEALAERRATCAPPAEIIDDYYPGGPFVPCDSTFHRRH